MRRTYTKIYFGTKADLAAAFLEWWSTAAPLGLSTNRVLAAIGLDSMDIPEWKFVTFETPEDLQGKLKAALNALKCCGYVAQDKDVEYSVCFVHDQNNKYYILRWANSQEHTAWLLDTVPDPRVDMVSVLNTLKNTKKLIRSAEWSFE